MANNDEELEKILNEIKENKNSDKSDDSSELKFDADSKQEDAPAQKETADMDFDEESRQEAKPEKEPEKPFISLSEEGDAPKQSEFEDEYIEEGYLDDIPYQWTITSYFNQIHQHFAFYCDNSVLQEQHVQYVFDSNEVIDYLKQKGFKVKVYTDFVLDGIQNGEKIFIVGEKIC